MLQRWDGAMHSGDKAIDSQARVVHSWEGATHSREVMHGQDGATPRRRCDAWL